jgi:hypothetical protein
VWRRHRRHSPCSLRLFCVFRLFRGHFFPRPILPSRGLVRMRVLRGLHFLDSTSVSAIGYHSPRKQFARREKILNDCCAKAAKGPFVARIRHSAITGLLCALCALLFLPSPFPTISVNVRCSAANQRDGFTICSVEVETFVADAASVRSRRRLRRLRFVNVTGRLCLPAPVDRASRRLPANGHDVRQGIRSSHAARYPRSYSIVRLSDGIFDTCAFLQFGRCCRVPPRRLVPGDVVARIGRFKIWIAAFCEP